MDNQELIRQYNAGNRDFRGVDLAGSILLGVNLSQANFYRAILSKAKLFEANLAGCNFSEAKLDQVGWGYAESSKFTPGQSC
jgi:uncharacterized protein YjbI with pentapeptide repeats